MGILKNIKMLLKDKWVKTRKVHSCSICNNEFPVGTEMRYLVDLNEGLTASYRCENCFLVQDVVHLPFGSTKYTIEEIQDNKAKLSYVSDNNRWAVWPIFLKDLRHYGRLV